MGLSKSTGRVPCRPPVGVARSQSRGLVYGSLLRAAENRRSKARAKPTGPQCVLGRPGKPAFGQPWPSVATTVAFGQPAPLPPVWVPQRDCMLVLANM